MAEIIGPVGMCMEVSGMRYTFTVTVEVERTQGKFASREEMEDQLREALEDANPGSLDGENGGEYEVTDWTVEG